MAGRRSSTSWWFIYRNRQQRGPDHIRRANHGNQAVRARHTGTFQGIPATGKDVHWTENHTYRLENGETAEASSEVSFHDLMAQITSQTTASKKAS